MVFIGGVSYNVFKLREQLILNLFFRCLGATMIKPISVTVLFSESKMLEEKDYSIEDFEQLVHEVAAKCELGYEKTDVKVTFDSGTIFNIDLSLGRGCDKSIKERLGKLKSYVEEFKERLTREELLEFGFLTKVDLEDIDNSKNKALYSSIIAEEAKRKEEEEKKAYEERQKRIMEHRKAVEAFQDNLSIPEDAQAVIVAKFTSMSDRSDPYTDYYETQTNRTIILAWSKHTRDLFSEMRKAALNHQDTAALSDKELSTEHREKYSMGRGFYLTNKDYIRCGIEIRKIVLNTNDKKSSVPYGEIAIPEKKVTGKKTENSSNQSEVDLKNSIVGKAKPIEVMHHTKKGHLVFVVNFEEKQSPDVFKSLLSVAKENNGYYSKFKSDGAIPGFHFTDRSDVNGFFKCIGMLADYSCLNEPSSNGQQDNSNKEPIKLNHSEVVSVESGKEKEGQGSSYIKSMIANKKKQHEDVKKWIGFTKVITVQVGSFPQEQIDKQSFLDMSELFLMSEPIVSNNTVVYSYEDTIFTLELEANISLNVH